MFVTIYPPTKDKTGTRIEESGRCQQIYLINVFFNAKSRMRCVHDWQKHAYRTEGAAQIDVYIVSDYVQTVGLLEVAVVCSERNNVEF